MWLGLVNHIGVYLAPAADRKLPPKCHRTRDSATVLQYSRQIGFLTGEENAIMNAAHCESVFLLGEPFASPKPYDFRAMNVPTRISEHVGAMLQHRLRPPPTEIYSLHRRLSGLFLGCAQLGAVVSCRGPFEAALAKFRSAHPELFR